jgi:hypothetical protein
MVSPPLRNRPETIGPKPPKPSMKPRRNRQRNQKRNRETVSYRRERMVSPSRARGSGHHSLGSRLGLAPLWLRSARRLHRQHQQQSAWKPSSARRGKQAFHAHRRAPKLPAQSFTTATQLRDSAFPPLERAEQRRSADQSAQRHGEKPFKPGFIELAHRDEPTPSGLRVVSIYALRPTARVNGKPGHPRYRMQAIV